MKNRQIRPGVVVTPDNPIIVVKCDPTEDELNVNELINQAITRFDFILGTSFDLQFLDLEGMRVLAMQRFIITMVKEEIITSDVNHYQTMTKNVTKRTFAPIGEMIIFDEVANSLRNGAVRKTAVPETNVQDMSTAQLQAIMKNLSGKGFSVGTKRVDMVKKVMEQMAK